MSEIERLAWAECPSPVGRLGLCATDTALVAVLWERDAAFPGRVRLPGLVARLRSTDEHPILALAARELGEYFEGRRKDFDLPLELRGTAFQRLVWDALIGLAYGETVGYGEIASRIGRPAASRAVGAAVGRNPISVIVPCHRVVGSGGALMGFAGGLEAKRYLLELEARVGAGSTRPR
jgi:methylated-DNA-[protein]-cysteine S-methyltransferase